MQGKSRFLYSSRACFGLFHSRLMFWNTVKVNSKRLRVADEIDISHNLVMSYSVIGLGKIMHKLLFPDYLYNGLPCSRAILKRSVRLKLKEIYIYNNCYNKEKPKPKETQNLNRQSPINDT